jgi:hypothetical protein
MAEPVPLSTLGLDLAAPAAGWAVELDRRGIPVEPDDLGRPSISRAAARELFAEHREDEARKARHREETERQAIEADRRFRAGLPGGIRSDAVPAGVTAAQLMMLSDPMQGSRRQSVLEHSLANPAGALIYHPVAGEPS